MMFAPILCFFLWVLAWTRPTASCCPLGDSCQTVRAAAAVVQASTADDWHYKALVGVESCRRKRRLGQARQAIPEMMHTQNTTMYDDNDILSSFHQHPHHQIISSLENGQTHEDVLAHKRTSVAYNCMSLVAADRELDVLSEPGTHMGSWLDGH